MYTYLTKNTKSFINLDLEIASLIDGEVQMNVDGRDPDNVVVTVETEQPLSDAQEWLVQRLIDTHGKVDLRISKTRLNANLEDDSTIISVNPNSDFDFYITSENSGEVIFQGSATLAEQPLEFSTEEVGQNYLVKVVVNGETGYGRITS